MLRNIGTSSIIEARTARRHLPHQNRRSNLGVVQISVLPAASNVNTSSLDSYSTGHFFRTRFKKLVAKLAIFAAKRRARRQEMQLVSSLQELDDWLLRDMGIEDRSLIEQYVRFGRPLDD